MVQISPLGNDSRVARPASAPPAENNLLWPWRDAEPERRAPWMALVVLMAAAGVLRAIALNQQLWYDEIMTLLDFVRAPLAQIVTTYTSQNQHMLYSAMARISVVLFGEQPWALRLPAVLFGVASVPALYFCARQVMSRREALLSCALLTVSYHHVWFSQNARGYTGLAFCTILLTYFFICGAREPGYTAWAWYAVVLALGMYVHLTMGFVAAGHGLLYLWLLVARRRALGRLPANAWAPLAGFVLAGVLTAALYAPVMGAMLNRTVGAGARVASAAEVTRAEWKNPLWLVVETMRGIGAGSAVAGFAASTLGGLVLLGGLVSYWKENRYFVGLVVMPGIVTAAAMLALSRNLWPRFFFFAIGFGLLLLVRGAMAWAGAAARLMKRDTRAGVNWGTALVVLVLLASCWQLRAAYKYPKQDFLGAMQFVDAQHQPGDAVVLVGLTTLPYQRYYGRDWPNVQTRAELETIRAKSGRTWVLYTLPIFVKSRYPELWNTLESEFTTVRVFRGTMGGGEVYVLKAEAR